MTPTDLSLLVAFQFEVLERVLGLCQVVRLFVRLLDPTIIPRFFELAAIIDIRALCDR